METKPIPSLPHLEKVFSDREQEAIKWKEKGGKVVGCLGSDVPEELIIAAGFLPIRICGNPKASSEIADRYLENGFDPLIRQQFARIVDGTYWYVDYLIISNSSDPAIRAYYYLRALSEVEPSVPIPKLYFFDFLHTRFRMSALYNRDRARDLLHTLEEWSEHSINESALKEAIEICNENRFLLQQMSLLRRSKEPQVSGVQALKVTGASMFMSKQEHSQLLRSFMEQAKDFDGISGVNLFVTGSNQDHSAFYEMVENSGGVIVGEDHDFGERQYLDQVDPDVDPIDGIVDRYHFRYPSASQATVSERVENLAEQVKTSGAEGVIFFIHKADDAHSWDFPEQKKTLEAMGISVLLIDSQPYVLSDPTHMKNRISSFIKTIKETKRLSTER